MLRTHKPETFTAASAPDHDYKPRGSAVRLFELRDAEVCVSGPAGTGKSRACLEKLHAMALVHPGMRGLIVRKTATSLTSTALVTYRRDVAPEAFQNGTVVWYGGSAQEAAQYRYSNGSTIVVGGLDKATRIMSSEYDMVYVQEATELTEDDWEMLITRLRNGVAPFQQLIADCNPDMPTHWLKQRCDQGRTRLLVSRHEDNPVLFDDLEQPTAAGIDYIDKLDGLTGVRYHRLRKGLWVAAEGVIYEEFDPSIHIIDSFDIPEEWTRWQSVDFGHTNPMVIQMWAEDPDGRLFLYKELYHTKLLVEDAAGKVKDWDEPDPRSIICDHDAEGRATLERHLERSTVPATKKVKEGIEAVEIRFRQKRLFIMRGALTERDPELVDAKKPTCTAEEIPGYVWRPDGKKEEPVKENDHGCDAMRYLVAQIDLRGRPNVRWL